MKFRVSSFTNIVFLKSDIQFNLSSKKAIIFMSVFKPEIQIFKTPNAIFVEKTILVVYYLTLWPPFSYHLRSVMNKPW